ncbi:hypothetical protein AAEX63_01755 [Luteococcus sp. H138]|uniref:hypothetical protein n=1 Tax=Luteococcus sp. H138 TaxID=3139404 RepID=UPI00313ABC61
MARALGTFHAVSCRDWVSMERDGEDYYAINQLPTEGPEPQFEVQFADSIWMLARQEDLTEQPALRLLSDRRDKLSR